MHPARFIYTNCLIASPSTDVREPEFAVLPVDARGTARRDLLAKPIATTQRLPPIESRWAG